MTASMYAEPLLLVDDGDHQTRNKDKKHKSHKDKKHKQEHRHKHKKHKHRDRDSERTAEEVAVGTVAGKPPANGALPLSVYDSDPESGEIMPDTSKTLDLTHTPTDDHRPPDVSLLNREVNEPAAAAAVKSSQGFPSTSGSDASPVAEPIEGRESRAAGIDSRSPQPQIVGRSDAAQNHERTGLPPGPERRNLPVDSNKNEPAYRVTSDKLRADKRVENRHRRDTTEPADELQHRDSSTRTGRRIDTERHRGYGAERSKDSARDKPPRDRAVERERDRYRGRSPGKRRDRDSSYSIGNSSRPRDKDTDWSRGAYRESRHRDRSSWREPTEDMQRSRRSRSRDDRRQRKRTRSLSAEPQQEEELNAKVEAVLDNNEDEDKLIEERRRRRQEIMAKHRSHQQLSGAVSGQPSDLASPSQVTRNGQQAGVSRPTSPSLSASAEAESEVKELWQHGEEASSRLVHGDRGEDVRMPEVKESEVDKLSAGLDMFATDEAADIFAETPPENAGALARKGLLDSHDDAEGYYTFLVGEILDNRYEVYANIGKGVFSTVLRAKDRSKRDAEGNHPDVAIKIIRANDQMHKFGLREKTILKKLAGADPEGKFRCVQMLSSFEHKGHLCLVFEPLDMNLRELTKKYGRGCGLHISAVHSFTKQLLLSLYHLKNCGVVHADIKPDNILHCRRGDVHTVKLGDFGSAEFDGDNQPTPYLVSRYYRAPEVILGLEYGHPLDVWSMGCVIYELFTGKILFRGDTNNEMLKKMMDVKGPFPKKMLKKGAFVEKHFESGLVFALQTLDPVENRVVKKLIPNPTVKKDFAALLVGSEGDKKKISQLADLLEKMTALDPEKRITPKEALRHAFIKSSKGK